MYTETGKKFGEGAFGKVVEVVDASGQRFAKKVCTREKYIHNTEYEKAFMEELKYGNPRHRGYNHVVQIEAAEQNKAKTGWDLIMHCYDGNLLELMESQHTYDDYDNIKLNALPEAVVRDLALHASFGLAYIGALGYAHCDLKPENILWKKSTETKSGYHFSIADFGNVAKRMDTFRYMQTRQYMCTENLLEVASVEECDMPSLGCILYEAIVGDYLADGRTYPEQISIHLEAIGTWTLDTFDSREIPAIEPYLKNVKSRMGHLENPYYPLQKAMEKARYVFSEDITDLIKFMLLPYPKQRIKAKNVCKHRWFDSDCVGTEYFFKMADPMVLKPAVDYGMYEEDDEEQSVAEQSVVVDVEGQVYEDVEEEIDEQVEEDVDEDIDEDVDEEIEKQGEQEVNEQYVIEIKVQSKKVRKEMRTKRYREKQHCLQMIHRKTKKIF